MKMVLATGSAVLLCGCWVPPSAGVRPGGKPRIIAEGIQVEPVADAARVLSLDRAAGMVALSIGGAPRRTYKVGPGVRDWSAIRTGEQVRATIRAVLTVYVPQPLNGRSQTARVLAVDPSYRLLTVQYPDGGTETFKIALHASMRGIDAGDSVAIGAPEVIRLRAR